MNKRDRLRKRESERRGVSKMYVTFIAVLFGRFRLKLRLSVYPKDVYIFYIHVTYDRAEGNRKFLINCTLIQMSQKTYSF